MMTRDSNLWWWVIAGSIASALLSKMDLIDAFIPENYHKQVHAGIELVAMITGIFAGVARMSPLNISPEGRADAIQKNADRSDKAQVAANVAAEAAAEAAKSSTVAAEASQVAASESTKASGIQDK